MIDLHNRGSIPWKSLIISTKGPVTGTGATDGYIHVYHVNKVTRQKPARVGEHFKEVYTEPNQSGSINGAGIGTEILSQG